MGGSFARRETAPLKTRMKPVYGAGWAVAGSSTRLQSPASAAMAYSRADQTRRFDPDPVHTLN
jgi:hypothetical protein